MALSDSQAAGMPINREALPLSQGFYDISRQQLGHANEPKREGLSKCEKEPQS
jgi:hypothetical protein